MTDQERTELAGLLSENKLLTHLVIACGVIADHPDATLGDRHPYSTEWNSSHAERVRGLRRKHEALRGATARLCRAISRRMQADEPTPEERIELMESYDAASAFLANVKSEPRSYVARSVRSTIRDAYGRWLYCLVRLFSFSLVGLTFRLPPKTKPQALRQKE